MASLCLRSMADALLRSTIVLSTSTSFSVIPPPSFAPSSASPPPKLTRTLCPEAAGGVLLTRPSQRFPRVRARAVVAETDDESKWWKKNAGPNMIDVHSTEEFISALSQAGDRLVIVEFYGTWCGSCRALFPKLCKTAEDHPDILFIKVNFDENKSMCKRLNVRVLPYFHFYRGSDGQLESFSCSLSKFQKIKDAIAKHNTARCSIGPPTAAGNLKELLDAPPAPKSK